MPRGKKNGPIAKFGIGEWYGHLLTGTSQAQRAEIFRLQHEPGKFPCPFKPTLDGYPQPCHKRGGVCSFRAYVEDAAGMVVPAEDHEGKLRIACPSRFLGGNVESSIARRLIGTESPTVIREVGFLTSDTKARTIPNEEIDLEADEGLGTDEDSEGADVGRIDLILKNEATGAWCAVEHQAVYFSGKKMGPEYRAVAEHEGPGLPMPKGRRPDYRSSGPKRLMPQLQIKVPTLRRWGKRMAVVIDESFFMTLDHMETVPEPSNADIAWVIVELIDKGSTALLSVKRVVYTTLESAVEGLTAGKAVSLAVFEDRIADKLKKRQKFHRDLVRKLRRETIHPDLS